ncbi:hypothetical protein [Streptomyces sp. NPDC048295]|uniref:hypothetical protein n=1 Tax=Streptomyces sp. NPDC048295 TaxID=3154617 RepID=UPI00341F2FDF
MTRPAAGVRRRRPAWLAVLGITACRVVFDAPHAVVGPRPLPLAATRVWALPNPSDLNAHHPPRRLAEEGSGGGRPQ